MVRGTGSVWVAVIALAAFAAELRKAWPGWAKLMG